MTEYPGVPADAIIQDGYWWDGAQWQVLPTPITQAVQANGATATTDAAPTANGHGGFEVHERLSLLIHGMSKKGKSTLAASAPKPVLVLDAEGSWRFIPGRKRYWDPMTEQLPAYDGTWDICVVHVQQWEVVPLVHQWLTQTQTPFVSVVIDSITELQRRLKANLVGTEAMRMQDWGVLLAKMDQVIRGYRDLTLIQQIAVRCVVFVSETRQELNTGRYVPFMQGQIQTALPYWVDICGYLYPDYEVDDNGQPTVELRRLWIGPSREFEAGERVQGRLGHQLTVRKPPDGQVGNDIEWWMRHVFGKAAPTQEGTTA